METETVDILTDERRCRDCLEFDGLRFLDSSNPNPCRPGWCKEQSIFTGPDWRICDLFKERKVNDAD